MGAVGYSAVNQQHRLWSQQYQSSIGSKKWWAQVQHGDTCSAAKRRYRYRWYRRYWRGSARSASLKGRRVGRQAAQAGISGRQDGRPGYPTWRRTMAPSPAGGAACSTAGGWRWGWRSPRRAKALEGMCSEQADTHSDEGLGRHATRIGCQLPNQDNKRGPAAAPPGRV